ncbi:hypothetical protein B0J13DRAFT_48444 [Dactylonectria estremocensis]|uniref:Uncharacterized protein n=1 Tax=Dactylonectria estremocensis TaxID=1079267 RepID=A0A9P9EU57_9HYPO|nr:hypothetical protein B0J13DRAFT_48444 [Dactylonectria estremocensis]
MLGCYTMALATLYHTLFQHVHRWMLLHLLISTAAHRYPAKTGAYHGASSDNWMQVELIEGEGLFHDAPKFTFLSWCSGLGLNAESTLGLDGRSVTGKRGGFFFLGGGGGGLFLRAPLTRALGR